MGFVPIFGKICKNVTERASALAHKLNRTAQIKTGLFVQPRVPEMVAKPELENLAKTYGKFWCTWQVDRGTLYVLYLIQLSSEIDGGH